MISQSPHPRKQKSLIAALLRPMESSPLHSKGHLPTRHHLPLLQHHKRQLGNLRHFQSLVSCNGHRFLPMVPLGRHTHHEHQHSFNDKLRRWPFKHYPRADHYTPQLNLELQQRPPLHEYLGYRPPSEHKHHHHHLLLLLHP